MARSMALMALVMAAAMALAGCAGGPADPQEPAPGSQADWWVDAMPHRGTDPQHDHRDLAHHQGLSSANFRTIGWNPLETQHFGTGAGTTFCGEVSRAGERVLAAYESFETDVALVVVDVTDPSAPALVGELVLPDTMTYDAALTDDGQYAVLALNEPSPGQTGMVPGTMPDAPACHPVAPVWRDACGRQHQALPENIPYGPGVLLVDLRDPTDPAVLDWRPQPVIGAHSVSAQTVDGVSYVIASTTNLVHSASYFGFYTIEMGPLGDPLLFPYGAYDAQYVQDPDQPQTPLQNGHVDGSLQRHPVTGQLLAFLADWDAGMIVVELVRTGVILPVGQWTGFGALHQATPMDDLMDGRHLTVVAQETEPLQDGMSTGYLALLDTTDPAQPQAVAWWSLPMGDVSWQGGGFAFSLHYHAIDGDVMYVSLYHGGVWAVDLRPENWPRLPTIGAFVPDQAPPQPPASSGNAPEVLDVHVLEDGTVVVPDAVSGIYTLRFDRASGVPAAPGLDLEPDWLSA